MSMCVEFIQEDQQTTIRPAYRYSFPIIDLMLWNVPEE